MVVVERVDVCKFVSWFQFLIFLSRGDKLTSINELGVGVRLSVFGVFYKDVMNVRRFGEV
jgi:hypothetical protein